MLINRMTMRQKMGNLIKNGRILAFNEARYQFIQHRNRPVR